jgi:hypothetical protein
VAATYLNAHAGGLSLWKFGFLYPLIGSATCASRLIFLFSRW